MKLPDSLTAIGLSVLLVLSGAANAHRDKNGKSDESGQTSWSGIPGDPNFSSADRIAIKNVMDAYSLYWDSGDVERFFSLFTGDAVRVMSRDGKEDISVPFQTQKSAARKRLDSIKAKGLQRRHLMANTHFLEQSDNAATIKQYTLMTSTENGKNLQTVTTVVYDIWLVKVDGIWKIAKYKSMEDSALDVKL